MMQFTKMVLVTLISIFTVFSEQQFSLTGGAGIAYEEFYPQGKFIWNGRFPISEKVTIQSTAGYEGVDAVTSATQAGYFAARTLPNVGNLGGDIRVHGKINNFSVRTEGEITPNSHPIGMLLPAGGDNPYSSDLLSLNSTIATGTSYHLNHEHITFGGEALYHAGFFDRFESGDSSKVSPYTENDLWYSADGAVKFLHEGIFIGGKILGKDDLNSSDSYNWTRSGISTGTNLIFNKRKTQIYSLVGITNLQGTKIDSNYYATGIGAETRFRMIQKIKGGLYLKGDLEFTGRTDAMKNRIGGSIRKTGSIGAVEGGYWITKGSLYPRQCGWLSGNVRVAQDHLDIESSLKNYWAETENSYRQYRTDLGLTCTLFPVAESRKISIKAGGLLKNMVEVPSYVKGAELFAGIESVL